MTLRIEKLKHDVPELQRQLNRAQELARELGEFKVAEGLSDAAFALMEPVCRLLGIWDESGTECRIGMVEADGSVWYPGDPRAV